MSNSEQAELTELSKTLATAADAAELEETMKKIAAVKDRIKGRLDEEKHEQERKENHTKKIEKARRDIVGHNLTIQETKTKLYELGDEKEAREATEWKAEKEKLEQQLNKASNDWKYCQSILEDDRATTAALTPAATATNTGANTPVGKLPPFPFPFPFLPPPPGAGLSPFKVPKERPQWVTSKNQTLGFKHLEAMELTRIEARPATTEDIRKLVTLTHDSGTTDRIFELGCESWEDYQTGFIAVMLNTTKTGVNDAVYGLAMKHAMPTGKAAMPFNNELKAILKHTRAQLSVRQYLSLLSKELQDKLDEDAITDLADAMRKAERKCRVVEEADLPEPKKQRVERSGTGYTRGTPTSSNPTTKQAEGGAAKMEKEKCITHPNLSHGLEDCFNPNEEHQKTLIAKGHVKECLQCKKMSAVNKDITFNHFPQQCRQKSRRGNGPSVSLRYFGSSVEEIYLVTENDKPQEGETETEEKEEGIRTYGAFSI
ncbi:hypothetical protein BDR26DRAFT_931994 [Obelidium mucronatum]|nr:hypothetical protein BDR26DRAFT_931994 [Obelidium mucronatum]